jgi:uncharacterized DUF497 family protein
VGFAWDPRKVKWNLAKHGVSFDDAKTVFDDDLFLVLLIPTIQPRKAGSSSCVNPTKGVCW